jgi:CheY-like chemotaxis protein
MSKSLVIADDDQDLRELLAEFLSQEGYEVATAANGREAIERVAARRPDLVISDIRMPVCDGLELARELAQREPSVPVLLISGYAGTDNLRALLTDPSRVRFLPKPINAEVLMSTIEKFLSERAAGPK